MAHDKVIIEMAREKETKNTVRFEEVVADTEHPVIRNLYVAKQDDAAMGKPDKIMVTIEAAK
jgi:hypothetical protein